ncbi:VanZ family protein [Mediterraneibacter gnavus]|nr:VanZ family protein [Mediterraneibacter gnavus]
MSQAGAGSIVIGIITIVTGVTAGIIAIVNGARLLKIRARLHFSCGKRGSNLNQRQVKRTRTVGKILFVLYIFFLLYFLIFSDWYGRSGIGEEYRCNLVLFKEIRRFVEYRETLGLFAVFTNLFGNILIFVPYGFFISVASRMRGFLMTLFYSLGLSLGVEVFQLLTRVGSFDVDDLLLNTIGGILGYVLFLICNGIRRKYDGRRKKGKKGK